MTFYNASIKTHLVDPIYDTSKFQTEFRLQGDTVYLSNMRLLNVGCTVDSAVAYNALAGAYSVIKSIHLYDGNQLLDQLLEANIWAAFTQYNKTNSHSVDMETWNSKNAAGLAVVLAAGVQKLVPAYTTDGANTAESTTGLGWLSLGQLLPFLKSQSCVPSTIFKNLRLVIHYDTDVAKVAPSNPARSVASTITPMLVVDELVSDAAKAKILKQYRGAAWNSIEHDRLVLDAQNDNAGTIQKSFTVNGFDNKNVNRLLIVNSAANNSDDPSALFGTLGSKVNHNQIEQIRVNGANVFARNGITRPAERLAKLTDAWGTCTDPTPFSGISGNDTGGLLDRNRLGNTDYFGCMVMQPISELQIDYQRDCPASGTNNGSRYRQQLFLNLFAEVPKRIVLSDGSYNVMYA